MNTVKFRKPKVGDIESLYGLILRSTGGRAEFTAADLRKDLFETPRVVVEDSLKKDSCMEFDIETIANCIEPAIQAIVAELDDGLIGYIIYHHYYSLWLGHKLMIEDFFTLSRFDRTDMFKRLEQEVIRCAKEEGSEQIMYNAANFGRDLVEGKNTYWHKDATTDWSMICINLNWNRND